MSEKTLAVAHEIIGDLATACYMHEPWDNEAAAIVAAQLDAIAQQARDAALEEVREAIMLIRFSPMSAKC